MTTNKKVILDAIICFNGIQSMHKVNMKDAQDLVLRMGGISVSSKKKQERVNAC